MSILRPATRPARALALAGLLALPTAACDGDPRAQDVVAPIVLTEDGTDDGSSDPDAAGGPTPTSSGARPVDPPDPEPAGPDADPVRRPDDEAPAPQAPADDDADDADDADGDDGADGDSDGDADDDDG